MYSELIQAIDEEADDAKDPGDRAEESERRKTEAKRYRWHRRAERNASLARDAKRIHGHRCQVCGLDFAERYGEIGEGYIEAHHLTPFSSLAGRPTALDPNTDFAVVCANCHRMIHRGPPFDLDELRLKLINVAVE